MPEHPPRPTPDEGAEMRRRRRGTNLAILFVLLALVVLFFAITIVKMARV